MRRNPNTRPGPKSKTQQNKTNQSFLGDSTATENSDAESFRSAELDTEQTDYGLDYTTSNSSPRRFFLKQTSVGRNQVPNENRLSGGTSKSVQNNKSSPNVRPISPNKNKRKQANPIRHEQRIWQEIRQLQKRTDNITPKAPFGRIIREILMQQSSYATRITFTALEALQLSSEIYLTYLFTDAYVCTLHRGRVTLGVHDLRLVRFLRGPSDSGNN